MNNVETVITTIIRKISKTELIETCSSAELLELKIEEIGFDSLENMEFIMQIEETLNVELGEASVIACQKVSDFVELIG